jgi:lysophospholipase
VGVKSNPFANAAVFTYHYLPCPNGITIRYALTKDIDVSERPICLLLHGRSEFIEKYEIIARHLVQSGFDVISADWRGQGLSSRETDNPQKGHINRFEDYMDDLGTLFDQVILPYGRPVIILAHSMGGHITLRFLSRFPKAVERAVLVSPMIDIELPGIIRPISKYLSEKFSRSASGASYSYGSTDYSADRARFRGNRLSHDPGKFRIIHDLIAQNPGLATGGVTWAWLNAAFKSIDTLKQEEVISKITTPLLIVSAQNDKIVSSKAQAQLSRQLPNCQFISIKGAFHELLFEEKKITDQVWQVHLRHLP